MSVAKTELKAKSVTTTHPVGVPSSSTTRDFAGSMHVHEISDTLGIDASGPLGAVVTTSDLIPRCTPRAADIPPAGLIQVLSEEKDDENGRQKVPDPNVCVGHFMNEDRVMVPPDLSASAVARLMYEHRTHRCHVAADDCHPAGITLSSDPFEAMTHK